MSYKLKDIVKLVDYSEPIVVCIGESWGWDTLDINSYSIADIPSDVLELEVFEIYATQSENVGFLVK